MKHYIYGAGGHGKVVLDAMNTKSLLCDGFIDDGDLSTWMSKQVLKPFQIDEQQAALHLAIGDAKVRKTIAENLESKHLKFFRIFHQNAVVSEYADIGEGVFVGANAIVAPSAILGKHSIVNHAATVDHDCVVGEFCHIAPHACLGGAVKVGRGVLIGSGAVVLPGVQIGDDAIIGAGAVVTKNVKSGATMVGTPARNLN